MRARHRHFNPFSAGAVGVYDARFISGLNDGDSVSTWASRTGVAQDISQATISNRPTYTTNQINGNPAIDFDGAGDQLINDNPLTTSKNIVIMFLFKADITTGVRNVIQNAHTRGLGFVFYNGLRTIHGVGTGFRYFGAATTNIEIITVRLSGTAASAFLNGALMTQTSLTINVPLGHFFIGADGTNHFDGKFAFASVFGTSIDSPIRKRCEHSAALSYKIACS